MEDLNLRRKKEKHIQSACIAFSWNGFWISFEMDKNERKSRQLNWMRKKNTNF